MLEKLSMLTMSILFFMTACTSTIQGTIPSATEAPSEVRETATPQLSHTPRPTSTPVPLLLQKFETVGDDCSDMVQGLPGDGLTEVAYVPSGFCFHGELDVFETAGHVYVAQAVMRSYPNAKESFRIIDVTDAEHPALVGAWKWNVPTFSADVKAFRQGDRWFLALSRDPNFSSSAIERLCSQVGGISIIEVTEPATPKLIRVLTGENTGSEKKWCQAHTSEVSLDANGNGAYLYVSAIDSFDLRVLDIRDLEHVVEVGHYTHPDGTGMQDENNWFLVHDTTIVGDRVYVAYWSAGLIILDRRALEAGESVTPLNPLGSIDPEGFQVHYAYPTVDGNFVFIEDELPREIPQSQLRLYDIRDLQSPKEVAAITLPDAWGSPHNFVVSGDLVFVGWYQDGVRVFKYDTSDPDNPTVEPYAFKAVRTQRTLNPYSQIFDGIWGVRLHDCVVAGEPRTCVYASDISWGLLILAMEPIATE
jgi:hypothetical protein